MRALVGDATEREAKTEASAWFRMDEARVRRGERCCTPWLRGLRNLRGEGEEDAVFEVDVDSDGGEWDDEDQDNWEEDEGIDNEWDGPIN